MNCLNCNTPLTGRYCSGCGQENRPKKLSVWQLLGQFFSGLLNYDGRLIQSILLLFSKPSALTIAYMEGKRSNYVNPAQFYLFTSAIYFLFSSTFSSPEKTSDSIDTDFSKEFKEGFIEDNRLPQVLFITLPLLALILKLVFIKRKHYWYIDHLIFILHIATSFFIFLFVQKGLELLSSSTGWSIISFVSWLLGISWMIYYLISFKRFFEKGWTKTLLLFFLSSFLQSILFMVVFTLLLVFAFFNL